MRDHSVESTIESGFMQAKGMETYAENAKGAPFNSQEVHSRAQTLQEIKLKQQTLKAQLHETTQQMEKLEVELKNQLTRNVSYFQAIWGKTDKRLEEVAGHALSTHHHHQHKDEPAKV